MNRVLLGYDDGTFKARVTKPGFDVLTETNIQNFSLHEAYRNSAIYAAGVIYHPANSGAQTIFFPALSYIPMCIILVEQTATNYSDNTEYDADTGIRVYTDRITIPSNTTSTAPPVGAEYTPVNKYVYYYVFTQQGQ